MFLKNTFNFIKLIFINKNKNNGNFKRHKRWHLWKINTKLSWKKQTNSQINYVYKFDNKFNIIKKLVKSKNFKKHKFTFKPSKFFHRRHNLRRLEKKQLLKTILFKMNKSLKKFYKNKYKYVPDLFTSVNSFYFLSINSVNSLILFKNSKKNLTNLIPLNFKFQENFIENFYIKLSNNIEFTDYILNFLNNGKNSIYNINYKLNYIDNNSLNEFEYFDNQNLRHDYVNNVQFNSINTNFKKSTNLKLKTRNTTHKTKILINMHKNKISLFRDARIVHWNKYKTPKILKEYRYKKFLAYFLKKKKHFNLVKSLIFFFKLPITFWKSFQIIYKNNFFNKIEKKKIYQLPINNKFWSFFWVLNDYKLTIEKKIKHYYYKKAKIRNTFWMKQKQKLPSFFFKNYIHINTNFNHLYFDPLTNYFSIVTDNKNILSDESYIIQNKLFKLNNYRYKGS